MLCDFHVSAYVSICVAVAVACSLVSICEKRGNHAPQNWHQTVPSTVAYGEIDDSPEFLKMAAQFGDGILLARDFPHNECVGGLVVMWVRYHQMWAGPVWGRMDEAVGAGDGRKGRRKPAEGREGRERGNTWKRGRGRRRVISM